MCIVNWKWQDAKLHNVVSVISLYIFKKLNELNLPKCVNFLKASSKGMDLLKTLGNKMK